MFLSLYSYYLIGNKQKFGFVIGLIGSIIGVVFFLNTSISLLIMYISFGILNIRGYFKWKQNDNIQKNTS